MGQFGVFHHPTALCVSWIPVINPTSNQFFEVFETQDRNLPAK